MIFDIAEGAGLTAITVNSNVFVFQSSIQELGNNEIGALVRTVGIEQTEDGKVQIVLTFERTQVGLPYIFYDRI